jgi:two-component system, OmpR family, sensor kinase
VKRIPIRTRITLGFAGAMALLLAGLGVFIYLRFGDQLDHAIDQGLRSRAQETAALIEDSDGGLSEVDQGALIERDESFAQILTPEGRVIDTSPQLGSEPVLSAETLRQASESPVFVERGGIRDVDGSARLLATPVTTELGELVVVAGASLDDRDDALQDLGALLLVGGAVALVLASLAGYGMATAAMRPVEAMRRRAAALSAADLDERLPVPAADDELRRLGETLNSMLDRLETAIERERTFVDDASHELRTPLTLHKTELELALRYGTTAAELRAAIASAIEEADRLAQLADDLLVVARSHKGRLALKTERVEVGRLLADIAARFDARVAENRRDLRVDAVADGLTVEADRLRLEQALTSMVDNALRHGGGEVRIRAAAEDGLLALHVADGGPGFPPEFIAHAFERFSRADPSRARGGTGLGLAIVDAIARAHGGSAGAANRREGGADVWIEVPLSGGPGG